MNQTLVTSWNSVVSPDDEVIFLVGNYDETVFRNVDDVHVFDHYQFQSGGYEFYCTHRPEDIPRNWSGWGIHGRHHNNYFETFPFVNPEIRRVNIPVELLNYEPVHTDTLLNYIDQGERLISVSDA